MAKIVGVLLEKEEDTRGSILGLLLILFLFAGIYLRIHIEQNEEKKIRETVFVQAISEKYKFKNKELQHSFIEWQKIN
jgi:apolipoprotein N-acyltransferase